MRGNSSKTHGFKEGMAEIIPAREKVLSPELMPKFKEPFGLLIPGPPEATIPTLRKLLSKEKASKIIAVGDVVSKSLRDSGIKGNLYVTDDKVMRERIRPLDFKGLGSMEVLRIFNPPGRLMAEAFQAIDNALRSPNPVRIVVEGEEDLLVLPAVILAPTDSLVLYGQPGKGLVVVRVTCEKKREALELYRAMPESHGT
ncbi:GTP-dependent dephospho-CoA kinase family protein [Candidatus Bathyarchaeota archaeon]|nr:GTP-dependent dephospho-CoA kinase family protein [Candidatus Bathyarchaeota archaeon]MBS7628109.1 GTP-dependent dephospho-CoA kinase family protein [Candidatus Bathyarchaeota archaeon]